MPPPANADTIERFRWVVEQLTTARRLAEEMGEDTLLLLLEQALIQAERDMQSAREKQRIL